MAQFPKVCGVSRMWDNQEALLVIFNARPTDDEMRAVHDALFVARAQNVEVVIPQADFATKSDEWINGFQAGAAARLASEQSAPATTENANGKS